VLSSMLDRDLARLDALAEAGRADLRDRYRAAVQAVTNEERRLTG
jgi:hypothetical protein